MSVRVFAATLTALCGCDRAIAQIDFERMIDQQKCVPYGECKWLSDGRTMQPPPAGTVPRSRIVGQPALTSGMVDGAYVADFPLEIDVADVRWGRTRFEIFCATCHGTLGTGQTQVAENMRLRKPPSLHSAAIRAYPPGRIFAVISRGYGLMPSYAGQLSVADRWAVVAYVQALQLSQDFSLTGEDAQGIREKLK